MTDDEVNEALCRVSQLTAGQVDGLEVLAGMTDGEVAEFAGRVDAVWNAHVAAVQEAKGAAREAVERRSVVEVEAGTAARARNPARPVLNAAEVARCATAKADVDAARTALTGAQQRFKAGVTAEQLAGA